MTAVTTPEALAAIHAASFITPRAWSAEEIAGLLRSPGIVLQTESGGFLIGRIVLDEAEILTVAVAPHQRRAGIGRRLVEGFIAVAQQTGVHRIFLEVSTENHAAARLYANSGFVQGGVRRGYFRDQAGRSIDAVVLCRDLS